MAIRTARPEELKQIVHETIGSTASKLLLTKIYDLLAEDTNDHAQSCVKIEQMVGLFISQDTAKVLGQKFRQKLQ